MVSYRRPKTGSTALSRFGEEVAALLRLLLESVRLFPYLRRFEPRIAERNSS